MTAVDDWPALYAHLLASPDDSKVLREDHVRKMNAALAPNDDNEQRVVDEMIELCALILDRQPQRRPTLGSIVYRVTGLIYDVLKLPVTSEEKEFMKRVTLSKARSAAASTTGCSSGDKSPDATAALASFRSIQSPWACEAQEEELLVAPRLFWNFFIAGTLPRRPRRRIDGSSFDILACKEFEVAHELEFVHFMYFCWLSDVEDDVLSSSPSPRQTSGASTSSGSSVISRICEDKRRTVVHIHPRLRRMYQAASKHGSASVASLLAAQMLQGLVQQAPVLFPVLQRRLREKPGRVVFASVPSDDDDNEGGGAVDSKALEDIMSSTLLFFLERSVAASLLDALATFARDCSPRFVAYPRRAFAHQLSVFACRQQQTRRRLVENGKKAASASEDQKKRVLVCLCGASVVTLQVSALRHALATQRCSCASSSGKCASFHPFLTPTTTFRDDQGAQDVVQDQPDEQQLPRDNDAEGDGDDALLGAEDASRIVPSAFIHDGWEEQLMLPMEVQARRHMPVPWVVVEREAVGRLDSVLDWRVVAASCSSAPSAEAASASTAGAAGTSSSSGLMRRASMSFDALKRLTTKDRDSPRPSPPPASSSASDPLLCGLSARASRPGDRPRPTGDASSGAWTLLECALCRLPMCAACPDQRGKVALPLLSDVRDACTPTLT